MVVGDGFGGFVGEEDVGGVGGVDEGDEAVVDDEGVVVRGEEDVGGLEVGVGDVEGGELGVEVGHAAGYSADYF